MTMISEGLVRDRMRRVRLDTEQFRQTRRLRRFAAAQRRSAAGR